MAMSLLAEDTFYSKQAVKDVMSEGKICVFDIDMQVGVSSHIVV